MVSHIYKRVEYSLDNALTAILLSSYVGSNRVIVNEKTKKPLKIDFLYHVHPRNLTSFAFWPVRTCYETRLTFTSL